MSLWKQLRVPLQVLIFANILFVFGRTILDPAIGKQTLTPFVFPSAIPLSQWQMVESHSLKNQIIDKPPAPKWIRSGAHYRYIQNHLPLDIEMGYEAETPGDVKQFIKDRTGIKFSLDRPPIILRQHSGVGFYGLFVEQQHAYLDACINSRGGSTFTTEQFSYNRIHYDVQFNRLLPWLIGQKTLRDPRCLWAHLSIPLNQSSPESAYQKLENAWFSWYQWWVLRFPQL
ncbi:MAG: hypothetical protein NVS2B14_19820 [Chamaesiphon sp.]